MTIQSRSPRTNRLSRVGLDLAAGGDAGSVSEVLIRLLGVGGSTSRIIRSISSMRRLLERLALDRRAAGKQFVEDHAKGVDVGAGIHVERIERRLFRRHVERRARHCAEGGVEAVLRELQPAGRLGQSEVDDLGDGPVVVALDQDVRRLQVAMDDPLLVRVLHGRADLAEQRQPVREAERGARRSSRSAGCP